jgi:hypothetical protein
MRERRFQSGQSKLTPSGWKIKTFLEGKEDWLEEGLLEPAKKKIKEEGSATIWRNSGTAELLR